MKARLILNLVLLTAVAGLGLLIYFKPGPSEPQLRLSTLQADDVGTIRIAKPGQDAVMLVKRGNAWFLTAPFPARADPLKVARILEIAAAKSARRFPAGDLSRFELDKPLATLTLGNQVFGFGTVNPLTREQYVATRDAVYLVSQELFEAIAFPASHFASRQLFADDETPAGFEFRDFRISQQGGKWVTQPARPDLGQDELNNWAQQWRLARSRDTHPAGRTAATDEIAVLLGSGKAVTLQILQNDPELVLRRKDENLEYHFSAEIGRRLLRPGG